jgi:hypothetical protein
MVLSDEKLIQLLLDLAALCEVKNHSAGSINLKIGLTSLPSVLSLVEGNPAVFDEFKRFKGYKSHKVGVGFTGGTVSIEYDSAVFPPAIWDDLGRVNGNPEIASALKERLAGLMTA